MDGRANLRENLKEQLERAERNAARFRVAGDRERYLESYFLAESLGTQLDALLAEDRVVAR